MLSNRKEMLESEIEMMEKQIPYLKGKNYSLAKRKYLRLIRTYETFFVKGEPIYLKRSE
jgi:uncharacterized protein (DUF488 family)